MKKFIKLSLGALLLPISLCVSGKASAGDIESIVKNCNDPIVARQLIMEAERARNTTRNRSAKKRSAKPIKLKRKMSDSELARNKIRCNM